MRGRENREEATEFGQPWPPLQPPFVAVERRNEEDGREERDDGFESEKGGRESCVCREGEGSAPPHLRPPEFASRAEERKREVA